MGGETRVTTTPAKTVLVGVFEVEVVEIVCLILDSLIHCAQSCESARGYFIAAYASSLHHCHLLFWVLCVLRLFDTFVRWCVSLFLYF